MEEKKGIILDVDMEKAKEQMSISAEKMRDSGAESKRKTKYKEEGYIEGRIEAYVIYLIEKRNESIIDENALIRLSVVLKQLGKYNFKKKIPTMQRVIRIFEVLDNTQNIGTTNANLIFISFPNILDENAENLSRKLEIVNQFNYMNQILQNPRKLMASIEWLYARLRYYSDMISQGKEKRPLQDIPASEILGDKDKFTTGEKNRMSQERKMKLLEQYQLPIVIEEQPPNTPPPGGDDR